MTETAARFRRVSDGFGDRIRAVDGDQWDNPTPCPAWTARDVVAHVINEQRRTLAQVRGLDAEPIHGVGVAAMGSLPEVAPDADLAAAWHEVGQALAEAVDGPSCLEVPIPTPMGPTAFRDIVDVLPEDVLIRTWDLARATGGDEQLDQVAVEHVYEHLKPLDDVLRQPWASDPRRHRRRARTYRHSSSASSGESRSSRIKRPVGLRASGTTEGSRRMVACRTSESADAVSSGGLDRTRIAGGLEVEQTAAPNLIPG